MATRSSKPTQAERTSAMRARLIAAAKQSLMDNGYGRTTAVEICERAGVTRGALLHHFSDLSELFAAVLDEVCTSMSQRSQEAFASRSAGHAMSDYIDIAWTNFGHPEFKIIIEVWLAARNDPALRKDLVPVIERIRLAMTPEVNERLASRVGRSADEVAIYRLVLEAMIGMALGRAISPSGRLGHEAKVVDLLKDIAKKRLPGSGGGKRRGG